MEETIDKVWTPVENLLSLKGEDDIREAAETCSSNFSSVLQ